MLKYKIPQIVTLTHEVDKSGFLTFGRVARSIQTHYLDIISFFERRATNAAAESFNAKIKAFRAQFRGVRDRAFFGSAEISGW